MKIISIFSFVLITINVGLSQSNELIRACEKCIKGKGVNIYYWENEFSPENDIKPWGVTQKECAGVLTGIEKQAIENASNKDYMAAVRIVTGDKKNNSELSKRIKAIGANRANWELLKSAYYSCCLNDLREAIQCRYKDNFLSAVSNWLISSEMIKAGAAFDGARLTPIEEGCDCSGPTNICDLIQSNIRKEQKRKRDEEELLKKPIEHIRLYYDERETQYYVTNSSSKDIKIRLNYHTKKPSILSNPCPYVYNTIIPRKSNRHYLKRDILTVCEDKMKADYVK